MRKGPWLPIWLGIALLPFPPEAARGATLNPNDFIVIDSNAATNESLVRRYTTAGMPDPAPGQAAGSATVVAPGANVLSSAWGPDGNLYVAAGAGVVSYNPDTNTTTHFTNIGSALGMAFGPDGNLYISAPASSASGIKTAINQYCGPLNGATCTPGSLLPGAAGQPWALVPGSGFIFSLVFGPDGNLYSNELFGGVIVRLCGPQNQACTPGSPLGTTGIAGDPTFASVSFPTDLAFGPDNNLYVSAIQFVAGVASAGQVLRFCGGPENSSLNPAPGGSPCPAANLSGAVFTSINGGPRGLDFGPDANLYVAADLQGASPSAAILRFVGPGAANEGAADGLNGTSVLVVGGAGGLQYGTGILRFPRLSASIPPPAPTMLFVSDSGADSILRYDASTGNPLPAPAQSFGTFVNFGGSRNLGPAGVVVGPDSNLYAVLQGTTDQVLRYNPNSGAPLPAQGQTGAVFADSNGTVLGENGLAFGPDGNLYVAGRSSNDVARFDGHTGNSLGTFVSPGAGGLSSPAGIAFGPDGNLYVSSLGTQSVLRYDGTFGFFMDSFVTNLVQPTGLRFGPDGNLYLSDDTFAGVGGEVERFDGRTGASLPAVHVSISSFAAQGMQNPQGLAFGPDLNLYVADSAVGAVLRYDGNTGMPLPSGTNSGAVFAGGAGSGLAQPGYLAFLNTQSVSISGTVDVNAVGSPLPFATVEVLQLLGGVLPVCPAGAQGGLAGLFTPCPTQVATNAGQYSFGGLGPGTYLVIAYPPNGVNLFPNSILVTIPNGSTAPITSQNIVLVPPAPIPAGTSVSPSTPAPVTGGSVPVSNWNQALTLSTTACAGATVTYTLALVPNPPSGPTAMAPTAPGSSTYTATIGPFRPFKGTINVSITVTGCGGGPSTSNFLLYIDPSGTAGSNLMSLSNRANPVQTQADGTFGWDVIPGFYQLQASAPGYTCNTASPPKGFTCVGNAVQSGVIAIPPAAVDLQLPLHKTVTGPTNVSSQVSVTGTGLLYSRVTQTFNGTLTATNTGQQTIAGPIEVVFTNLTSGVTLVNASGTTGGNPYLTVPGANSLAPGQAAKVSVQFKNPSNALINFTPVTYSGSF